MSSFLHTSKANGRRAASLPHNLLTRNHNLFPLLPKHGSSLRSLGLLCHIDPLWFYPLVCRHVQCRRRPSRNRRGWREDSKEWESERTNKNVVAVELTFVVISGFANVGVIEAIKARTKTEKSARKDLMMMCAIVDSGRERRPVRSLSLSSFFINPIQFLQQCPTQSQVSKQYSTLFTQEIQ